MIHYSCIGATGYVCGEVLRMMVNHHEGELVNVLDTYGVGDAISTHHPLCAASMIRSSWTSRRRTSARPRRRAMLS